LEEDDCALSRTAPNQLAPFSLTVLDVNVPAGILQTAIAERAIDKYSLVQDEVLIFKNFTLESIHHLNPLRQVARLVLGHCCVQPGINRSAKRTRTGYASNGGGATRGTLNAVVYL
jgi:hypothetical protein